MKKLLLLLGVSVFLVSCDKLSSNTTSQVADMDGLKATLAKEIPGISKIDQINNTPIPGIYEVVVGRKVFYSNNDGKYLFFGNLVDAVKQQSLTEDRVNELSKIDTKLLPTDLAIKEVNGTGKRVLYVFSDPDCPYCHMFEKQTVPFLPNTTIYTFLYPLNIHPNAKSDAEKIWCSKDRLNVWHKWMRDRLPLAATASCDTSALDKVYKIGTDLVQVNGTPTLILSNGQIIPGALPVDQLIDAMDKADGIVKSDKANSSNAK